MTTEKASPFLAGIKSEVSEAFASAYDEIAKGLDGEVPPVVGEAMKRLNKRLWSDIVEKRLKESFLNGKRARGARVTSRQDTTARGNPFRVEEAS